MKIEERKITVRQLTEGYKDNNENGVVAYGGKLDVRPPYQREFVYNDAQRQAVITTIKQDFPLNIMYWAVREDGSYELIDGQQRTISICQYVNGDFDHDFRYFHNLPKDAQEQILNYSLSIYICEGTDSEKLDWFKVINTAGERLNAQELRNAIYTGVWLTDAKLHFSKTGCVAYKIGEKYLTGTVNRQDYFETVLKWISDGHIESYMAKAAKDYQDAGELWLYFQNVINWVTVTFPKYRTKAMKGNDWGFIYNKYKDVPVNPNELEKEVAKLIADSDVQNKKGIYWYVFDHDDTHLNIRVFDDNTKQEMYEKQQGICSICHKHFEITEMEADHITPWSQGGRTIADNCQMLCRECNRRKSAK